MCRAIWIMLCLLGTLEYTRAGEFNSVLNLGDAAPAWSDLEGVDGQKHSLAELKDHPAVVVVFTCNSCPIAEAYEDRIIALAKEYADRKVAVVAINVNTIPADRLPKMKERATKKGYPFAYLHDPTQKIAKAYGAMYTPEFFLLNAERKIAYMGALDDKNTASEVKEQYLRAAIQATLAGTPIKPGETLARGCRIRWNRDE